MPFFGGVPLTFGLGAPSVLLEGCWLLDGFWVVSSLIGYRLFMASRMAAPGEVEAVPSLRAMGRGEWEVAASGVQLQELVSSYPVPGDLSVRVAALLSQAAGRSVGSSGGRSSFPRASFLVVCCGDSPHLVRVLSGVVSRGAVGPLVAPTASSRCRHALSGSARILDLIESSRPSSADAEELNRRFFAPRVPSPSSPQRVGVPSRR